MNNLIRTLLLALAATASVANAHVLSFAGWTRLPDGTTEKALGGASYAGNIHLFAVGQSDNKIYENIKRGGAYWSGWREVDGGGLTGDAPAAVAYGSDLLLFVRGFTGGQIWFNRKRGTDATWQGWAPIAGLVSGTAPSAAVYRGQVHLFASRLEDNRIFSTRFPEPDTFSAWAEVGGGGTTRMSVGVTPFTDYVASEGESLFVFGVGIVDRKIYMNKWSPLTRSWTGWGEPRSSVHGVVGGTTNAQVPGATVSRPFSSGTADTRYRYLAIFAKGINDSGVYLNQRGYDIPDWTGFFNIGGVVKSAITPVVFNNTIHLYAVGTDFGIWENIQRPLRALF